MSKGRTRTPASRSAKAPPSRQPGDNRPTIRLKVGELEQTVTEAERALIDADRGVYQRANFIVTVGTAPVITADRKKIETQQILQVGEHRLLELIMSSAYFEKWDARSEAFVAANVPMSVVKALEQRRGHFRLPPLSGLVNAPTMRDDGSLLATRGYDQATGLLFDPGETRFARVPRRPSREDARAAIGKLNELINGFPFVGEADRAVALAMIITSCVRRSLRTAPMFVFTAPVAGSGKSKLVDIASVIATGREAGVISQGASDEETEKRLTSLLLSGSAIAIDNVEHGIGGDLLCQLLTQTTVRMRVLGKSEAPEMPTNVMASATGNNVVVLGDMTRRALVCRLDPGVERPEMREFAFEPVSAAKAQRGELVVAVLTILRAYHLAGRPAQTGRFGSFEEWSELVRGALVWLGQGDPVDTIEQGRTCDPALESLRSVMIQWRAVIGSDPVSSSDAARRASEKVQPFYEGTSSGFRHPDCREAFLAVASEGGYINPSKLGTWLGRNKNRVVDGMRFQPVSASKGIARWRLSFGDTCLSNGRYQELDENEGPKDHEGPFSTNFT